MPDGYTVESALAELREMFPVIQWLEVAVYWDAGTGVLYRVEVYEKVIEGKTLNDCMAQMKKWRESPPESK